MTQTKPQRSNVIEFPAVAPVTAKIDGTVEFDVNDFLTGGQSGFTAHANGDGLILRGPDGAIEWLLIPVHN